MSSNVLGFTQPPIDTGLEFVDKDKALNRFLSSVQQRGFQMARIATANDDDALDIVQDTMMKLVQKYRDKSEADWKPLFFRILQSRIYDYHRRNSVKQKVFSWFGLAKESDEDTDDFIQVAPDQRELTPEKQTQLTQATTQLKVAISQLPIRQQQAFLMRMWEGMSTAETAQIMEVTEGSVKTHYSRALSSLRSQLEGHW